MRSQQKANLVEPYRETLIEVDARADQKTGFAAIAVAYGEPHRHCHTLEHIAIFRNALYLVRQ
jgi:predicted metal-dependent HD superfamily phosphohydrolase|tara:strand:+ start:1793 stop:1981 length:189 start_codon:yes stop_codon:yes gene_type:complete